MSDSSSKETRCVTVFIMAYFGSVRESDMEEIEIKETVKAVSQHRLTKINWTTIKEKFKHHLVYITYVDLYLSSGGP